MTGASGTQEAGAKKKPICKKPIGKLKDNRDYVDEDTPVPGLKDAPPKRLSQRAKQRTTAKKEHSGGDAALTGAGGIEGAGGKKKPITKKPISKLKNNRDYNEEDTPLPGLKDSPHTHASEEGRRESGTAAKAKKKPVSKKRSSKKEDNKDSSDDDMALSELDGSFSTGQHVKQLFRSLFQVVTN